VLDGSILPPTAQSLQRIGPTTETKRCMDRQFRPAGTANAQPRSSCRRALSMTTRPPPSLKSSDDDECNRRREVDQDRRGDSGGPRAPTIGHGLNQGAGNAGKAETLTEDGRHNTTVAGRSCRGNQCRHRQRPRRRDTGSPAQQDPPRHTQRSRDPERFTGHVVTYRHGAAERTGARERHGCGQQSGIVLHNPVILTVPPPAGGPWPVPSEGTPLSRPARQAYNCSLPRPSEEAAKFERDRRGEGPVPDRITRS
jgi:hypothetical protein